MPCRAPLLRSAVLGGALLLAVGCGTPGAPIACTEIGAEDGVSVVVAAERAREVSGLALEVCWEGRCREPELRLEAGSTTVDLGCSPDGACSGSASPNGTLVGFAPLDLPEGEVEVRAAVTGPDGQVGKPDPVRATAEVVRPNGPQCPGEAHQLALTLDSEGLSPR